jgi:hypothetical protein
VNAQPLTLFSHVSVGIKQVGLSPDKMMNNIDLDNQSKPPTLPYQR